VWWGRIVVALVTRPSPFPRGPPANIMFFPSMADAAWRESALVLGGTGETSAPSAGCH
jgi:hypothetical protein